MSKASYFKGTKTAKVNERGEYLGEGEYEVEIKRCHLFTARDKTEYFIVEMKVIESTNEKHAAGVDRNWMVKMNQDTTDGNLKGFALAGLGVDKSDKEAIEKVEDGIPDTLVECLDDPKDPECKNGFKGLRLHVRVKIVKTKPTKQNPEGTDFSAHDWSPSTKAA
jgi:hypothetical protein